MEEQTIPSDAADLPGDAMRGDATAARLARMWLCTHYADEFEASDIESLCWSILGCKDRVEDLLEKTRIPVSQAIELACSEAAPAPVAQGDDAPSEYMRGYSDGVEWARQQERDAHRAEIERTMAQAKRYRRYAGISDDDESTA